ncbi:MAG TPA: His/Gly/Thr/Pro-type tRNA ligase C-terminal domain-containing protein, partial [Thermomicrobiales bacterium]|nr:His/Gly/Thr/Pro-type tRNA ligase C-terminal domain-containing protein [Thermomicrobiales bacterium]
RNAQMQKVPYMLVIGGREAADDSVSVRLRSGENLGAMKIQDFVELATPVIAARSLHCETRPATT